MRCVVTFALSLAAAPLAAQSPWQTDIWAGYGQVMTDWFAVSDYTIAKDGQVLETADGDATEMQGLGVRAGMRARKIGAAGDIRMLGAGVSALQLEPLDTNLSDAKILTYGAYAEGGLGYVFDMGLEAMVVVGLGIDQMQGEEDGVDVSSLGLSRRAGVDIGWNFNRGLLSLGVHSVAAESFDEDNEVSYSSQVITGSYVWWF